MNQDSTYGDYGVGGVADGDRPDHDFGDYGLGSLGDAWQSSRPEFPSERSLAENLKDFFVHKEVQDAVLPEVLAFLSDIDWFRNNMGNKKKQDLKQFGKYEGQYEQTGNWNYGVVAAAAGFDLEFSQRAAGAVQKAAGTSSGEFGLLSKPYGDDPADQQAIEDGFDYYNSHRMDLNREVRQLMDHPSGPIRLELRLRRPAYLP